VNNVCVIVPLRSSQAPILLEQLIGRGLRLMWREPEYHDIKIENRELIGKGKNPRSLIDVLSIVEHPAFQGFYDDLIKEGLVGEGIDPPPPPVGDMISVGLREGFEEYDFEIPTVIQEADESLSYEGFKPETLPPFTTLSRDELKQMLGKGDVFISQDLLAQTLFGDYRVDGAVMHVDGYNDYLTRLTRRISQLLSEDVPKGKKISAHANYPYLQIERPIIAGWLDDYIRETLFGEGFDPMEDENWRLLLLKDVLDHLVKVFSDSLLVNQERPPLGEAKVLTRKLSEIKKLMMRESHSVEVNKCIYERLPFPAHSGGLEEAFIAWADHDGSVAAFCKISETKHAFLHLRYAKEDGFQAFYSPDFLVRTTDGQIYLVETKAQAQVSSPNVQRKLKAAQTWCERINDLPEEKRGNREWHYVLLGEETFYNRRDNNDTMANMLRFAKVHGREKEEQLPLA
jgi:type III restriction enzyme